MYLYDQVFMSGTTRGNFLSSRKVTALLAQSLRPRSVADFGCAEGGWLSAWREQEVTDLLGLDGPYVPLDRLRIPKNNFKVVDLEKPVDLGRRFDLVMSVEVAEHLSLQASRTLVESLTRHANVVLFSAAPPGQGGEYHINEQSYDYWRDIFYQFHYVPLDFCRLQFKDDRDVQPWYRYNLFLYINTDILHELPGVLTATLIAPEMPIPDIAPWWYRLRKQIVRRLPFYLCQWLAKSRYKSGLGS